LSKFITKLQEVWSWSKKSTACYKMMPRVVNDQMNIHEDGTGMTRTSALNVKAVSLDKLGL